MITDKDRELFVKLQRWKGMTMRQIQAEVLKPLYLDNEGRGPFEPPSVSCEEYISSTGPLGALYHWRRRASPCRCGGTLRAPSNLVQYLEMCTACGEKFGETPTWNE